MQFQRPNPKKHIALAFSVFTSENYKDVAYQEILNEINNNNFNMSYTYAIYSDQCMVKENIFLPIFHSYYLNSDPKLVILRSKECYDLPIVYNYHEYFIYNESPESSIIVDQMKSTIPNVKISLINSLKDICNELQ
jgi:hypothetical protein